MLAAYISGLFIDLTADTGKYGTISRAMFESGDYINLKIHGEPYEQKPPLMFWLATLGFEIGGVHNWSFKLFPVLYGLLGIFFAYKLGESLYNKRTGQLTAAFLASSEVYFLYTMDTHMDLLLQANVSLALWQLSEFLKHKKVSNFVLAFVGVGLGMMSKGAIGGAIPAFALGTHLIIRRQWKELFHPRWLVGIIIALLITTPAFLGLYNQFGWDGLKFFFITNNVGRITGDLTGSNTDYFFYFHTILYLVLPWTFLFLFAIYHEFHSYLSKPQSNREYFTLGGIWIFFVIASIAKGKAPHYIFTLIPLFFVLTAKWTDQFLTNERLVAKLIKWQQVVLILLAVLIVGLMSYISTTHRTIYWLLLGASIGFVVALLYAKQAPVIKLLLSSIILISYLSLYLNTHVLPRAFAFQGSTQAADLYNQLSGEDETLFNYGYSQYELFFYSKNGAERLYSIDDLDACPEQTMWVFTPEYGLDSLEQKPEFFIEGIHRIKHMGMNQLSLQFINPATRYQALSTFYLLKLARHPDAPSSDSEEPDGTNSFD